MMLSSLSALLSTLPSRHYSGPSAVFLASSLASLLACKSILVSAPQILIYTLDRLGGLNLALLVKVKFFLCIGILGL